MLSILKKSAPAPERPAEKEKAAPGKKAVAAAEPPPPAQTAPAPHPGGEKRAAPRHPASDFPAITGLRFTPLGIEARLINISATGLLAEVEQQLKPGSAVTVAFMGTFEPRTSEGRVARCVVSSVARGGRLRYHVAVAYKAPIPLGNDVVTIPQAEAAAVEAVEEAPAVAAEPTPEAPAVPPPVRNRW